MSEDTMALSTTTSKTRSAIFISTLTPSKLRSASLWTRKEKSPSWDILVSEDWTKMSRLSWRVGPFKVGDASRYEKVRIRSGRKPEARFRLLRLIRRWNSLWNFLPNFQILITFHRLRGQWRLVPRSWFTKWSLTLRMASTTTRWEWH